jgi:hypothetical protein
MLDTVALLRAVITGDTDAERVVVGGLAEEDADDLLSMLLYAVHVAGAAMTEARGIDGAHRVLDRMAAAAHERLNS